MLIVRSTALPFQNTQCTAISVPEICLKDSACLFLGCQCMVLDPSKKQMAISYSPHPHPQWLLAVLWIMAILIGIQWF